MRKKKNTQSRSNAKKVLRNGSLWQRVAAVLLLAFVSVTSVVVVDWLRDPQTLPLRSVKIEGEFRYLAEQKLEDTVAPYVNAGFFSVDVVAIRAAVEALPWTYRASVRRVWPDSLRVYVEEQRPLARWGNEGLVNNKGEFFSPDGARGPQGLPFLSGPTDRRKQVVSQYLAMDKVTRNAGRTITRLVQDQRRAWFMEWDNGVALKLGRLDPYPRLLRFLGVYPDLLAVNSPALRTVDLRFGNGFSVRWGQKVLQEPGQPG